MSLDDPVIAVDIPSDAPAVEDEVELDLEQQVQPAVLANGLPPRFCCFVTGTDTEIGKTLVSSAMLHALVKAGVRACGISLWPLAPSCATANGTTTTATN